MQVETIHILKSDEKLASAVIKKLGPLWLNRPVIAISGESGCGKTTLAYALCLNLRAKGLKAKLLQTDHYYLTHPEERTSVRLRLGIDQVVGRQEYDWYMIEQLLHSFKNKKPAAMPLVDLFTGQVDTLFTDFGEVDILILEGLYAIASEPVDFRIFMESQWQDTIRAQKVRRKEQLDDVRIRILQKEKEAVQSLRPLAGLVISNRQLVPVK